MSMSDEERVPDVDDLETDDLADLLGRFADVEINRLSRILTEMPKLDLRNRCVTSTGIEIFKLNGRALIPGIVHDVAWLGSTTTGRTRSYRQILQSVAQRHGIDDDGEQPLSVIERAIQRHYLDCLRPDQNGFVERPAPSRLSGIAARIPFSGRVAQMVPGSDRVLTALVLEIAALRRIGLMRDFAASLEVV